MGPKTKELIKVLEELISLLQSEKENHWLAWLIKSKSRIENSDFSGIELFLSAYGGMGSFSDLVLNGSSHNNEALNSLRSKAWWLAEEIRHEQ